MENLTKQQVILLALLVAFATSISTGIVVASILDSGSESVTQTIYKVVEKTIQEVAPESSVAKKIVEKANNTNISQLSQTVSLPQEKPLILSDIAEKAGDSIFKIYDYISSMELKDMISVGIRFNDTMDIIGLTPQSESFQGKRVYLVSADGTKIKAKISKIGKNGYSLFTIDEGQSVSVSVSKIVGTENQRIGYSVVSFGAKAESNVVSTGIVSSIESDQFDSNKDSVVTDIKPSTKFSGFVLFSTSGEVIGLIIPAKDGDTGARYVDPKLIRVEFPSAF